MIDKINKRLDEIKGRCEAATEGPWHQGGQDGDQILQTSHITRDVWYIPRKLDDVTFMANSRTDLPATVAALRKALEYLSGHNPECVACGGSGKYECQVDYNKIEWMKCDCVLSKDAIKEIAEALGVETKEQGKDE